MYGGVCAVKRRGKGVKKTGWRCEEVKKAVDEKKRAYLEW